MLIKKQEFINKKAGLRCTFCPTCAACKEKEAFKNAMAVFYTSFPEEDFLSAFEEHYDQFARDFVMKNGIGRRG